ncbi:hypothetical protein ACFL3F_01480 [Planctomycetota bacterium]
MATASLIRYSTGRLVIEMMARISVKKTSIRNIIIFAIWFLPIFFAPQSQGFLQYGLGLSLAKASYVIPVILGIFFLAHVFFKGANVLVNKYGFALLLFIYAHTFFSDVGECSQVFYFLMYGAFVHIIGYNYPKTLFRQYLFSCKMISTLVVVDFIKYFTTGSMVCHWHALGKVGGIPRIHTFFNEPAHQATFLMPAVLYLLFCNRKGFHRGLAVLLFAYLATFSVGAIVFLIIPVSFYYLRNMFRRTIRFKELLLGVAVGAFVFAVAGEFMFEKLGTALNTEMYYNTTKVSSGANVIAMIDIVANTKLTDLVLGVGYYNVGTLFAEYLESSNLYSYFLSQGFFDGDYTSCALVRMLYAFGLLGVALILLMVRKIYASSRDTLLATVVIVALILFSSKETHALNNLVFIFFFFGLFWGEGRRVETGLCEAGTTE